MFSEEIAVLRDKLQQARQKVQEYSETIKNLIQGITEYRRSAEDCKARDSQVIAQLQKEVESRAALNEQGFADLQQMNGMLKDLEAEIAELQKENEALLTAAASSTGGSGPISVQIFLPVFVLLICKASSCFSRTEN